MFICCSIIWRIIMMNYTTCCYDNKLWDGCDQIGLPVQVSQWKNVVLSRLVRSVQQCSTPGSAGWLDSHMGGWPGSTPGGGGIIQSAIDSIHQSENSTAIQTRSHDNCQPHRKWWKSSRAMDSWMGSSATSAVTSVVDRGPDPRADFPTGPE